eukprot:1162067-Pelagomonas_calceolata.AAC.8
MHAAGPGLHRCFNFLFGDSAWLKKNPLNLNSSPIQPSSKRSTVKVIRKGWNPNSSTGFHLNTGPGAWTMTHQILTQSLSCQLSPSISIWLSLRAAWNIMKHNVVPETPFKELYGLQDGIWPDQQP